MGRLINKRSETPKKKKASDKAAARKPTGKAVGRKSDIDTVKTIDPTAKKSVVVCMQLKRTEKKRAARIADGDTATSAKQRWSFSLSALHRGCVSYSLPARLHWTRARRC
jgi:hypothetical protein